ncbi:MAG: HD domain-containing protein [Steroidobacteraceae bacterium]|jgi:predicted HD phosphohydrolase|nr:HD domain-containing protein [Steroidobacteraceae bacterium]
MGGQDDHGERARFTALKDCTAADVAIIFRSAERYGAGLADRMLAHLRLLGGDFGGFPVDRLEHCLQSATRAQRAGMDEEYVACALLHDVGDTLGPYNHPEVAAAILRPFVSEAHHWMVLHHAVFQGYYHLHHAGLDPNARERHRSSPHFDLTADFCERFDQAAFDPGYPSLPLEEFEPLLRRLFARPRTSTYHAPAGAGGAR